MTDYIADLLREQEEREERRAERDWRKAWEKTALPIAEPEEAAGVGGTAAGTAESGSAAEERQAGEAAETDAAAALRNIIVSGTIRERLVESDLFAIGFDVFHDKCEDERLKIQIVGIFKRMCKEEKFRQKVAESHFLTMAANDKPCYCPVLKVAAHLPEMSKEEKFDFMDAFARIEYANDDLIDSTLKAFPVVSSGIEDCEDCAMAINKLLKVVGCNVEGASMLLDTAMKCESVIEILHSDGIYVTLLESSEYDSAIKRKVCDLVRKFNDPVLEPLIDAQCETSKTHV